MGVGGGRSGPFFGHLPLSKRPCSDFAACKTILLSAVSQIFLSNCIQALKIKRKKKSIAYSKLFSSELKSVIFVLFVIVYIPFHFCECLIFFSGDKSSRGTWVYFLVWFRILKVTQPLAQEMSLRGDSFQLLIKKMLSISPIIF